MKARYAEQRASMRNRASYANGETQILTSPRCSHRCSANLVWSRRRLKVYRYLPTLCGKIAACRFAMRIALFCVPAHKCSPHAGRYGLPDELRIMLALLSAHGAVLLALPKGDGVPETVGHSG